MVAPVRFSTEALPPRERFDAWRNHYARWIDVSPPAGEVPPQDFPAEVSSWGFGGLVLTRADAPQGVVSDRSAPRLRRDMIDHWAVLVARGRMLIAAGGQERWAEAEEAQVFALSQPFVVHREAASWTALFIPRDLLAGGEPLMEAWAGRALTGGLGGLLAVHVDALPEAAAALSPAELALAAEATLSILRAAVAAAPRELVGGSVPLALRSRLRALIREEMGSVRLCPARLAARAGLSRTRLYELFEPEGGVARAVQRERLAAAARALADPGERRPIARIAEDLGMPDPSVFSRAFRREFAVAPRDFRDQALIGLSSGHAAARQDSAGGLPFLPP